MSNCVDMYCLITSQSYFHKTSDQFFKRDDVQRDVLTELEEHEAGESVGSAGRVSVVNVCGGCSECVFYLWF